MSSKVNNFAHFLKYLQSTDEVAAQALRSLGYVSLGGADVGELLVTLANMPTGDVFAWHEAFNGRGDALSAEARRCKSLSSRIATLHRAFEYRRQGEFFLRGLKNNDARRVAAARDIRLDFGALCEAAAAAGRFDSRVVSGDTYYGYVLVPRAAGQGLKKCIVFPSGYDSFAEEAFHIASALLADGFTCLLLDGPGQGHVLRRENPSERRYMTHAYGDALSPFLDEALPVASEMGADSARLGCLGSSFAGHLALAAVAGGEQRIRALVLDPPQPSFGADQCFRKLPRMSKDLVDAYERGDKEKFNDLGRALVGDLSLEKDGACLEYFWYRSRLLCHGCPDEGFTLYDYVREMEQYHVSPAALASIRIPILACETTSEHISMSSVGSLRAAVAPECRVTVRSFDDVTDGSLGHCESGAKLNFARAVCDFFIDELN